MSNTLERIAENLFTSQTVVMSPTEDVKVRAIVRGDIKN
jgi:hypothetical protein